MKFLNHWCPKEGHKQGGFTLNTIIYSKKYFLITRLWKTIESNNIEITFISASFIISLFSDVFFFIRWIKLVYTFASEHLCLLFSWFLLLFCSSWYSPLLSSAKIANRPSGITWRCFLSATFPQSHVNRVATKEGCLGTSKPFSVRSKILPSMIIHKNLKSKNVFFFFCLRCVSQCVTLLALAFFRL